MQPALGRQQQNTQNPYGGAMANAFVFLLSCLSLPVEFIYRRQFGVRYCGPLQIAGAYLGLSTILFFSNVFAIMGNVMPSWAGYVFAFITVIAGIYHFWEAFKEEREHAERYTYAEGISHVWEQGGIDFGLENLQRYVEPVLTVAFGIVLIVLRISDFAAIFIIAGLALFIKEQVRHQKALRADRDVRDSKAIAGSHEHNQKHGFWMPKVLQKTRRITATSPTFPLAPNRKRRRSACKQRTAAKQRSPNGVAQATRTD